MNKLRLKFWHWAHKSTERLWHWIYYNRLPEGIEQTRKVAEAKGSVHSYSVEFVNSKGEKVPAPIGYASGGDVAHIIFNGEEVSQPTL